MASAPNRSNRSFLWMALFAVLIAVGGYLAWQRWGRPKEPDPVALLEANNKGIGEIEQFRYPEAVEAFEKVVEMAPNWVPGRINLGIALLNNSSKPAKLQRALLLFQEILQEQPDNPYAHFCTGLLYQNAGKAREAAQHFEAVTRIDPNDAHGWLWLGRAIETYADQEDIAAERERAKDCFRRALDLNPYLAAALYGLAMSLRFEEGGMEKSQELLKKYTALVTEAKWADTTDFKYGGTGRYGLVIGLPPERIPAHRAPLPLFLPDDQLQIQLATGERWATAGGLGKGPIADLHRMVRKRFGCVLVVFDYNSDGRSDLFLLNAVVKDDQVQHLLLRNDGHARFTDVTAEAGLVGARLSLGCCVADYDNDGRPDLFLTGAGEQRLFRNAGDGKFEDVTAKAGFDKLTTVCLGATFVDLDQDSDLDLVIAQYAATVEEALANLAADKPVHGAGLAAYLNVGGAPPVEPIAAAPPLETRFERAKGPESLLGGLTPAVNLAVSDCDRDGDVDLLVLTDGQTPELILNDRLLRFRRQPLPADLAPAGNWNGALTLDADHDGQSDLLLVGPKHKPAVVLSRRQSGQRDVTRWFEAGVTNSPLLLQAQAIDLDLDGLTDVVGLTDQRKPTLLHNDGQRLVHAVEALGRDTGWPEDLAAVAVADVRGKGLPDLLVWSEGKGLLLSANQGNGNHGLKLELIGSRGVRGTNNLHRVNRDGHGTRVTAHAGVVRTSVENTTLSAGLGQSRQPLWLGLGRHTQADVLRFAWTDNSLQAEFNMASRELLRVEHVNRKPGSCPVLFAWNGRRFEFVTDFLGAGSMGESQPDGTHRPPRPEESVKIEPHQLAIRDGRYELKVSNPMDEVHYMDRLQLVVHDHPADVRVYPDERFAATGTPPTQELLALRQEAFPVRARDHRGRDMTDVLRTWDRNTADGFARRAWVGYAEEHWVELDFGDRLASFGPKDRLILCLAGWTDYAFPDVMWAATQAGITLQPPALERRGSNGAWQPLVADTGFPAGLPRMMTLDVSGKLGGTDCVVRLRTNMAVFWDQVFVAPVVESGDLVRRHPLEIASADLAAPGCAQEFSPDGRQPTIYDHDRREPAPMAGVSGYLTRLGDVSQLLRVRDDRFVIFGPGEEVTLRFDARTLPELPSGWKRSFILRAWGYTKDAAPFTAHSATVEPLPFHKMSNYPYGSNERHPDQEYQRQYNTRRVGPRR